MPVRIVVADDEQVLRHARVELLNHNKNYEVVAQAADGREALFKVRCYKPDILLLDLMMSGMDGFEVLRELHKENNPVKTIVVSRFHQNDSIAECMELGARGFLSTYHPSHSETDAIDSVMQNGFYFTDETSIAVVKHAIHLKKFVPHFDDNTVRFNDDEMHVLDCFLRQLENKETWTRLHLTEGQLIRIKNNMIAKLKVKNFMGIVVYAIQKGLIDVDSIPLLNEEVV